MHEPLLEFNVITAESCLEVSLVASVGCERGWRRKVERTAEIQGVRRKIGRMGWAWHKQMSCREISVEVSVAGFFPKNLNFSNTRLQSICMLHALHTVWCNSCVRGCYRLWFLVVGLGLLSVFWNAIVYEQNLQQTRFPSVSFLVIFSWGLGNMNCVFTHEVGVACLQKLQNTCLYMLLY